MADKTTGGLPAVEEAAIGSLPGIADLYDDTLLKSRHLQGGGFVIPITQETAETIAAKVLEIREQLAGEYPLSSYLDYFSHPAYMPIRLGIRFYDAAHGIPDAESLSEYTVFFPYDKKFDENDNIVYRDTLETILADIDKTIYGIVED